MTGPGLWWNSWNTDWGCKRKSSCLNTVTYWCSNCLQSLILKGQQVKWWKSVLDWNLAALSHLSLCSPDKEKNLSSYPFIHYFPLAGGKAKQANVTHHFPVTNDILKSSSSGNNTNPEETIHCSGKFGGADSYFICFTFTCKLSQCDWLMKKTEALFPESQPDTLLTPAITSDPVHEYH